MRDLMMTMLGLVVAMIFVSACSLKPEGSSATNNSFINQPNPTLAPSPNPTTTPTPTTLPPGTLTYYQDIKPILDQKCAICHQPGQVEVVLLHDYSHTFAVKTLVSADVQAKTMPPNQAQAEANPNLDTTKYLTATEQTNIKKWVDSGAAEGKPTGGGGPPPAPKGLPRVDMTTKMQQPYYADTSGADDYENFYLPTSHTTTKYITGYQVIPGNKNIVHHVLVLVVPAGSGGATGSSAALGKPMAAATTMGAGMGNLVGVYVPGTAFGAFPTGIGIKLEPGSQIMLQMHYHTHDEGSMPPGNLQPDQTSVQLMLEDKVAQEGFTIPLMDLAWPIVKNSMLIKAGSPSTIHSATIDPFNSIIVSQAKGKKSVTLYNGLMHMHKLGKRGTFTVQKANNSSTMLLDFPNYDYNFQATLDLKTPVTLTKGQKLVVSCEWDNSPENQLIIDGKLQPPQDVTWGEGTNDEMCLGGILATAK